MLTTHVGDVWGVRGSSTFYSRDDEPEAKTLVVAGVEVAITRDAVSRNPATTGQTDRTLLFGPYGLDITRYDEFRTDDSVWVVETVTRRKSVTGGTDHTVAQLKLTKGTG